MASFILRLFIAPLFILSIGFKALGQTAPELNIEGASLSLPVVNDNEEVVDQITYNVVEVTSENQNEVFSLRPYIILAKELPNKLPGKSLGVWTRTISSKIVTKKDRLKGLAIAATSSVAGYLGLWYVAGNSASSSAIISTTMFGIALFQASFTNQWQSYLQKGLYIKNLLGLLKKDLIENELVKSIGNISAAAAFNIAPTTLALSLSGHYHNFATAALTGVLGAYDYTVDIAAGKLNRRGYISDRLMRKIVGYRLIGGPILEMFSLNGDKTVQHIMAGIGTLGILAILRGEKLVEDIDKFASMLSVLGLRRQNCRSLLSAYPAPHIRSFEDTW